MTAGVLPFLCFYVNLLKALEREFFVSRLASVAQWIEHLASDQGVVGSTPAGRARKFQI